MGVCGHVCYAWPQTSGGLGQKKIHCLYCEKWVNIHPKASLVIKRVPIPRPKKPRPHPGQLEIPF